METCSISSWKAANSNLKFLIWPYWEASRILSTLYTLIELIKATLLPQSVFHNLSTCRNRRLFQYGACTHCFTFFYLLTVTHCVYVTSLLALLIDVVRRNESYSSIATLCAGAKTTLLMFVKQWKNWRENITWKYVEYDVLGFASKVKILRFDLIVVRYWYLIGDFLVVVIQ